MRSTPEVPELGSLAQSVRARQLRTARAILLFVGIITIIANAAFFAVAEKAVDEEIKKELASPEYADVVIDQAALAEFRDRTVLVSRLINGAAIGVGVVYVAFGIFVNKYPIPITVTGLVLYIGGAAIFGYLDPTSLARGWLIKILIIVGLFKAIQAAIAFENERKQVPAESDEAAGVMPDGLADGNLAAPPVHD